MKTVHRKPVELPKIKIDNRYLNQTDFHGINDNQNIETIDKLAFASAENVYIDSNNVLFSRPPIIEKSLWGFAVVFKVFTLGDITLVLGIPKDGNLSLIDIANGVAFEGIPEDPLNESIVCIRIENRVFIFLNKTIVVYEDATYTIVTIQNANNYLYIPAQTIFVNAEPTAGEQRNELVNGRIEVHIAGPTSFLDEQRLDNKTVTFTLGEVDYNEKEIFYTTTWIQNVTRNIIFSAYSPRQWDKISIADNGTCAIAMRSNYIFYSVDGKTWNKLDDIDNILSFGISDDGFTGYVIKSDGLWLTTLIPQEFEVNEDPQPRFVTWTNVLPFITPQTVLDVRIVSFVANRLLQWIYVITQDTMYCLQESATNFGTYVTTTNTSNNILSSTFGASIRIRQMQTKMVVAVLINTGATTNANIIILFVDNFTNLITTTIDFESSDFPICSLHCKEQGLDFINDLQGTTTLTFDMLYVGTQNTDASPYVVNMLFKKKLTYTLVVASGVLAPVQQSANMLLFPYNVVHEASNSPGVYLNGIQYVVNQQTGDILCKEWYWNNALDTFYAQLIDFGKYDNNVDTLTGKLDISIDKFNYFVAVNKDSLLYTNTFNTNLEIKLMTIDAINAIRPEHWVETNNSLYMSQGNTLYIEQRQYDKNFNLLLYFPEINTEIRANQITNLTVIERGVVALFHEHEVWYVALTEVVEGFMAYAYYKSRITLGCKAGADVAVLFDGQTICYGTPRGVVGMNYQELTQNIDQILKFMSDNITTLYQTKFANKPLKIFQWKFWVYFYKDNESDMLVFDVRTLSWWYWSFPVKLKDMFLYDNKPLLIAYKTTTIDMMFIEFGEYTDNYKDFNTEHINWHIQSEPNHFNLLNNYKAIKSISFTSLETGTVPFTYELICKNFRDATNITLPQVGEYKVDTIRTYINRLNYYGLVMFQWQLSNDKDVARQMPLCITGVAIRYEVKGRLR